MLATTAPSRDGRADFDFLLGSWSVRNRRTVISPDACRWEQAFSVDGGQAWETNWIMEFIRQARTGS